MPYLFWMNQVLCYSSKEITTIHKVRPWFGNFLRFYVTHKILSKLNSWPSQVCTKVFKTINLLMPISQGLIFLKKSWKSKNMNIFRLSWIRRHVWPYKWGKKPVQICTKNWPKTHLFLTFKTPRLFALHFYISIAKIQNRFENHVHI